MSAQEMATIVQRLADTVAHRLNCAMLQVGCTCGAWEGQAVARADALRVVRVLLREGP